LHFVGCKFEPTPAHLRAVCRETRVRKETVTVSYCVNHPETETRFACMKHDIYMCEDCLECRGPDIYCKFRTSCPIWFLTKRKGNLDEDVNALQPNSDSGDDFKKAQAG
jgi:hypothetical protein